jgi:hypothetical protein
VGLASRVSKRAVAIEDPCPQPQHLEGLEQFAKHLEYTFDTHTINAYYCILHPFPKVCRALVHFYTKERQIFNEGSRF